MTEACHDDFMIISEVCLYIKSLSLEEKFGTMVLWLYEKVVAIPEVCWYSTSVAMALWWNKKRCRYFKSLSQTEKLLDIVLWLIANVGDCMKSLAVH